MRPGIIRFLALAVLLGVGMPWANALAQDKDRPRHLRDLPPEEHRQAIDRFRQERAQNPEKFKAQQEEFRAKAAERAKQADTNRDGALSRQEAGQSMPGLSKHFDEIDANRDGVVTREELRAFREKRRQQRLNPANGDPRF